MNRMTGPLRVFSFFIIAACGLLCLVITNAIPAMSQPVLDTVGYYKLNSGDTVRCTPGLRDPKTGIIYFKADFDLDADGSPCAYNESNTGLLHNLNGKNSKGKWFAVVTRDSAKLEPVKQDSTGVCPGYYISTTSLLLAGFDERDCRHYVNPDSICYFVLPGGKTGFAKMGIKKGDVGIVFNTKNQRFAYAIFADSGPPNVLGEGSMKLARALQVPCRIDGKGRLRGGMDADGIVYIVLPGSGQKQYTALSDELIRQLVERALADHHTSMDELRGVLEARGWMKF